MRVLHLPRRVASASSACPADLLLGLLTSQLSSGPETGFTASFQQRH
jgi:hypothetical protein